jgi:hypothetical protein
VATALTLFVIPALYLTAHDGRGRLAGWWARRRGRGPAGEPAAQGGD